jgi:glycine cleavage system H protein
MVFWVLGVSDKLVKLLKVVTIVTLDNSGTQELRGYPFGYIESAKMNTDLISPISGKIVQTNSQVLQHINDQPYTGGWMIVIEPDKVEEMDDLMSAKEYAAFAWNKTQN